MITSESRNGWVATDRLYRALVRAHSPLAAALMAASVTGEWPHSYAHTEVVAVGRR
ncbi:hypothetical protein ACIP5Y_13750 [Nocardia sp. NPDC088792]|uniref:hypothetical protein n=1 Tax=Nocardia sp. NPDC088792 TaxID=3364332 RepID=UPI0037F6EF21